MLAPEEDKGKIGLAGSRRGYLRSISALPGSLVRGTVSLVGGSSSKGSGADGDSLADQWLEFLIQQEQAADAEDAHKLATAGEVPADTYVPPPAFSPRSKYSLQDRHMCFPLCSELKVQSC